MTWNQEGLFRDEDRTTGRKFPFKQKNTHLESLVAMDPVTNFRNWGMSAPQPMECLLHVPSSGWHFSDLQSLQVSLCWIVAVGSGRPSFWPLGHQSTGSRVRCEPQSSLSWQLQQPFRAIIDSCFFLPSKDGAGLMQHILPENDACLGFCALGYVISEG